MPTNSGRHFLQIPGPTNVPNRILRAMSAPTIDHRGPEFGRLTAKILDDLKRVFKTKQPVMVFPGSGSGAWEAALVNTLSPGDKVLAFESGQFATQWAKMATDLGLDVEFTAGDWRGGVDPADLEQRLAADASREIRAVMVVQNETSTGVTSRIDEIRQAMDRAGHPALLLVDAISSLGCTDLRHDEWGIDVTVCGSQKGLMLPPGLCFNAISEKALDASRNAALQKSYWEWAPMLAANESGFFPYTPATNLLYGLREALQMLLDEGLEQVFQRHGRLAEATRRAVGGWGLEILCRNPEEYSSSLTAVLLPEGHDADELRRVVLERFNLSLGSGLGKVKGRVFRIGHLGDFNELMLVGTLAALRWGLSWPVCRFPRVVWGPRWNS